MEFVPISTIQKGDIVTTKNRRVKPAKWDPSIKFEVTRIQEHESDISPTGKAISLFYEWKTTKGEIVEDILIQRFTNKKVGLHNQ